LTFNTRCGRRGEEKIRHPSPVATGEGLGVRAGADSATAMGIAQRMAIAKPALTPPLRWHPSPAAAGEGKRRFGTPLPLRQARGREDSAPLSRCGRRGAGGEGQRRLCNRHVAQRYLLFPPSGCTIGGNSSTKQRAPDGADNTARRANPEPVVAGAGLPRIVAQCVAAASPLPGRSDTPVRGGRCLRWWDAERARHAAPAGRAARPVGRVGWLPVPP
jgi:hypothetical protein